ncbi:MAG: Uma2 family endonuclease [Acidobacteria bacterium]|nr:Uma2 family endonuclease [Acidobacteriota bacterium]
MSVSKRELAATIFYPETDGKPMGETDLHIKLIVDISEALRNFFLRQPDVYVSRDLLLYYVPGNARKFVVPDVFVVRGVNKGVRRVYKLWEEGRPPNVVIEISSRETKNADLNRKFDLYEQLGVAEYYIFDPEYRYIKPPLRAWRLSGDGYVEIAVIHNERGVRVNSDELGLELVDTGQTLRLFNPATGEYLLTPEEEAAARQEEAAARQEEAAARQEAEARVARLAAKLRELGVDPDKL